MGNRYEYFITSLMNQMEKDRGRSFCAIREPIARRSSKSPGGIIIIFDYISIQKNLSLQFSNRYFNFQNSQRIIKLSKLSYLKQNNFNHRSNFIISERGVKNGPQRKQLTGGGIRRTSRKRRVKGLGERIKGNPIILKRIQLDPASCKLYRVSRVKLNAHSFMEHLNRS